MVLQYHRNQMLSQKDLEATGMHQQTEAYYSLDEYIQLGPILQALYFCSKKFIVKKTVLSSEKCTSHSIVFYHQNLV